MAGVIRGFALVSCACAALVVCPAPARAQARAFVDAVLDLTATLEGTFGDEGAAIGPALNRASEALVEWDRAIRAVEVRLTAELANASPQNACDLRLRLATTYAERGRMTDAMRELDAAGRADPRRPDVFVLRGLVLATSAKADEPAHMDSVSRAVDAAFYEAWALAPDDPAIAYHAVRRSTAARAPEQIERARNVLSGAYRTLLEGVSRSAGLLPAGVSPWRHTPISGPVLPLARYASGYARLAGGDYDGAIAELRRAVAADPLVTDPAARSLPIQRAIAALREGRLAAARSLVEGAHVPAGSSEGHRIFGLILWASADYDKSIEQLTSAITSNPRDERSRLTLARVLSAAKRDAEAERVLRETIRQWPDSALAHWWLGLHVDGLGRHADARREIERAAAGAIAGQSSLYAAIGRLAASATDVPAAIAAFQSAVDASPHDSAAHRNLAGALLQQDRDGEAFIEFVAALLINPMDAEAHAGIGRIHLDAGRYADAVGALRRAVDVMPEHSAARYALAAALMRVGKTQDAAREFERVEDAQRRALAERRRQIAIDVVKEGAVLEKSHP